jgi:hypothetical protein
MSPEIPNVVTGEVIDADLWGNPIRDRTLQRYANEAERDSLNPAPTDGDMAFIQVPDTFETSVQVYDHGSWVAIIHDGSASYVHSIFASPLTGTILYQRQGGIITATINVSRPTAATVNGEFQIAGGIPTAWAPSGGSMYFTMGVYPDIDGTDQVATTIICRHATSDPANIWGITRVAPMQRLRGSWAYKGSI